MATTIVLGLLSSGACSDSKEDRDGPTRAECAAARLHRAKLAVEAAAGSADADESTRRELAKHAANLAAEGRGQELAECEASETSERIACVMAARDVAALAACGPAPEVLPREERPVIDPVEP